MGLLSGILGLFGCKERRKANPQTFTDLRNMLFSTTPERLGLKEEDNLVWGLVMETGYPDGVVTLVSIADGTVSLYFDNGGGIIGLGQKEGPRKVSEELLSLAPDYVVSTSPTSSFPLPKESFTRFYFLTFEGVKTMEAKVDDLGNNRHALSP